MSEFATKFFTTASGGEAVMMIGYCYVTENYFCFAGKRASAKGSTERLAATLSLLDIANIQEGISPFLDRYKVRVTCVRKALGIIIEFFPPGCSTNNTNITGVRNEC